MVCSYVWLLLAQISHENYFNSTVFFQVGSLEDVLKKMEVGWR